MWEFMGRWWISAAVILAIVAFLDAAIQGAVTFHDGLAALCVSSVALVEVIREDPRKPLRILGAIGAILVSYLWFANGAQASPIDIKFLAIVIVLFVLALFSGFAPAIPFSKPNQIRSGIVILLVLFALIGAGWAILKFLLPSL